MTSARSLVFADANVLYASAPRDILIELALEGVIGLRWSPTVLEELSRALVRSRPEYTEAKARRLVTAMNAALPDASVTPPDPPTVAFALPDPDDAHVALAAHHAGCDTILTFNLDDFPAAGLAHLQPLVTVVHPDAFLVQMLTGRPAEALPVIEQVRQNLVSPPMPVGVYADSLARSGLPRTGDLVRRLLSAGP
jgi:predicted nucleic acid-binding protein